MPRVGRWHVIKLIAVICFSLLLLPLILQRFYSGQTLQVSEVTPIEHLCQIPHLEPWYSGYPKADKLPQCKETTFQEDTVVVDKGRLRIKADRKDTLTVHGCSLIHIVRESDSTSVYGETVSNVSDGFQVTWPSFKVVCRLQQGLSNRKVKDEQYFTCGAYPPLTSLKPPTTPLTSIAYNILFLGMDSISRMSALRYLPSTMRYIATLPNAFVMQKYHVVGDGTTASLLALLTGYFEEELPEARKSHVPMPHDTSILDDYPWIWDVFDQAGGYATHYIEDMPMYGTFHYRLVGFGKSRTPTHVYGRPCVVAAMQDELKYGKELGCIGSRYTHHILLESMREFFNAYADRPRFSLTFLAELIHENPAYATLFDEDLVQVLRRIQEDDNNAENERNPGSFANTIVFMFADHGSRIGAARLSLQGKVEERLPILAVILPKRLIAEWPEAVANLRTNTDRLMTMFDVHATLEDILIRQYGERAESHLQHPRGQSLFSEIASNRTCEEASIAAHWCTCLQWFSVSAPKHQVPIGRTKWSADVEAATEVVVKYVNAKIATLNADKTPDVVFCSSLKLVQIVSVEKATLRDQMIRFTQSKDKDGRVPDFSTHVRDRRSTNLVLFRLDLVLSPGDVHIEATVRVRDWTNVDKVVQVRRLDRYEPTAWCQPRNQWPEIRQFCVCERSN